MIKEVLLLFKTHLDVGYTDYSENVAKKYVENFIPNAIKTGYELKDTDTPFVWTVGSWLIWEGLKHDESGVLDKAIRDGIIAWHGLPLTTHTEAMNEKLFKYGLSLSESLDKRFGKKTIGAKMTDVPGHTIGMVPHMKKAGIRFLHLGTNSGVPVPNVPPIFRWKCGEDEIIVMYQGTYGTTMEFDDFAICFGHTGDNSGAQSVEQIKALYAELREKYPDANIKAATLNDVAEKVIAMENLPVVEKEIGDTWIHGMGTDPKKVGMYRKLLRHIENMDLENYDLTDNLLLLPEHTWGMNLKVYFPNVYDWTNEQLRALEGTPERVAFEKSWEEQRDYAYRAAEILGADIEYDIKEPNLDGFEKIDAAETDFEISWQLFDRDDYQRFMDKYLRLTVVNVAWCIWDFLKLGLPEYKGGIYNASVTDVYKKGEKVLYRLDFAENIKKEYGLPHIWVEEENEKFEIKWFGKEASRLPQAFWLKFRGYDENWEINKLGRWIKTEDIIDSPLITAVYEGIRNEDVQIDSLDAALVAPFGRRLLDYEAKGVSEGKDLYFNLYNNIWNTNFPMWYSDDTEFRFVRKKR